MRRGDGVGVARYAEQRRDGILVVEGVVAHGASILDGFFVSVWPPFFVVRTYIHLRIT